jgi:hypothetical protein
VLLEGVGTEAPLYDERALVHAPSHRLLVDGLWQPGPLPALDGAAQAQADAFLAHVAALAERAVRAEIEAERLRAELDTMRRQAARAWAGWQGAKATVDQLTAAIVSLRQART